MKISVICILWIHHSKSFVKSSYSMLWILAIFASLLLIYQIFNEPQVHCAGQEFLFSIYLNYSVLIEWNIRRSYFHVGKYRTLLLWPYTRYTDSIKINRPEHNIRMYWTNFRQPTAHLQQNIFGKTLIEVCSLHLYASFGTFCVQIGQLFAAQWVFKHSEEFRNRRHFPSKTANCRFSNIFQRLTVPRIMDQF